MFINSRVLFGARPHHTLAELSDATRSDDQATRVCAMQALINLARRQPSARAPAVEVFRSSLATEWDPYTAIHAVRGLNAFGDPAEARAGWLSLLRHPKAEMVAVAALSVPADFFAELMEILGRRSELQM